MFLKFSMKVENSFAIPSSILEKGKYTIFAIFYHISEE